MAFGQPGFFAPHKPLARFTQPAPTSWYDTAALKTTLERLVDFDRINARQTRLSVGAVNVRTGNFAYFDNAEIAIRPEHIMASGALPPGFPAVEIDAEQYWDGGHVSNTPLQYMMDTLPRSSRIVFQVDLFSARGPRPGNIDEAETRAKDIRYSSRTRAVTDNFRRQHDIGHNIQLLWEHLSDELRNLPEAQFLYHASSRDGHRPARPPPGGPARQCQGLRVRPPDDARALGGRRGRCHRHPARLALAGATTAPAWRAQL